MGDSDDEELVDYLDGSIQKIRSIECFHLNGQIISIDINKNSVLCAVTSRLMNRKSSLNIITLPDWIWNYTSVHRKSNFVQQKILKYVKNKYKLDNRNLIKNLSNLPFNKDFIQIPMIIPLPYGSRERAMTFSNDNNIVSIALMSCRGKHKSRYINQLI